MNRELGLLDAPVYADNRNSFANIYFAAPPDVTIEGLHAHDAK